MKSLAQAFAKLTRQAGATVLLLALSGSSYATFHLWRITQLYSNADGTVQFVEFLALASGQEFVSGHTLKSSQGTTTRSYTVPTDLPGDSATSSSDGYYGMSTSYKSFVIGTQGFAALNVVKPDYIIPNGFLFTTNGQVNWGEGADVFSYASLPTDGTQALFRGGSTGANSPLNFAGEFGTVTAAAAPPNYQGLWWNSPANSESGWGLNIAHQGDILFATWFTYDLDGSDMWLVMSNGSKVGANSYSGPLYRNTGPAFNAVPFTSLGPGNFTTVGSLSLSFTDASHGTMTYTVNGTMQTKQIERFVYSSPVPTCTQGSTQGTTNYQDLWWNSPANSESGWGVNLTHQGDILFATWFTYDLNGKGMWLVMSGGVKTAPGVYSGALRRNTGAPFSASPWNSAQVAGNTVGNATFTFTDSNTGTFAYTVNGVSQTKSITRLVIANPTTVCR
jgi:hypothetical protein